MTLKEECRSHLPRKLVWILGTESSWYSVVLYLENAGGWKEAGIIVVLEAESRWLRKDALEVEVLGLPLETQC